MLFAQLLAAVAVDRSSIFANSAAAADRRETEESLGIALASRLGQLTSLPPVLTDLAPHDETGLPQPLAPPSGRVILLRSLVLFLKLATLTFNVKADRFSGQKVDSDMHPSVQALWHVTFFTAADFLDQITDVKPDGTRTAVDNGNREEQTLCVVLCEHAAATLRQALKEPGVGRPRQACLQLLTAVLAGMPPDLLRQQIKQLGMSWSMRWARALRLLSAIQPLQLLLGPGIDSFCIFKQSCCLCRAFAIGSGLPEWTSCRSCQRLQHAALLLLL